MDVTIALVLLGSLVQTGVLCTKAAVFLYSRVGGDVLLPCGLPPSSDCSSVSWSSLRGSEVQSSPEVSGGQARADSGKSSRMSVTSGCSLRLRLLEAQDAGTYICLSQEEIVAHVYLSLLAVAPLSGVGDLRPGGSLVLSCILFTYYDALACTPYTSGFTLSWASRSRFELIGSTRCNVTLVTQLQHDDHNSKWRCQLNATGSSVSQDFTSAFLFLNPSTGQDPGPLDQDPRPSAQCPVQLAISRIVLCVCLPLMVMVVGCSRRRGRHTRTSTAAIELRDVI